MNDVIDLFTGKPLKVPAAEDSEFISDLMEREGGLGDLMELVQAMTEAASLEQFVTYAKEARRLLQGWDL